MTQQKNKNIVIAARQAATAVAFIPLYKKFVSAGFNIQMFASGAAYSLLKDKYIEPVLVSKFEDFTKSVTPQPDFMLTGTSEFPEEDYLYWQWAYKRGITSAAFVDSWISYWQRFTTPGKSDVKFNLSPDIIAVADELMLNRMKEFGCCSSKLVITGNPWFEILIRYIPQKQDSIRKKYGEYFLFAGEPFNERVYGGTEKHTLGFTEAEVLNSTAEALKFSNRNVKFLYKPHPRGILSSETNEFLKKYSAEICSNEFDGLDLAAGSKAVIGMTSLFLYETALAGIKTISYRPGSKLYSDVIDGHPIVKRCFNFNQLVNEITSSTKPNCPFEKPVVTNASENFIKIINNRVKAVEV